MIDQVQTGTKGYFYSVSLLLKRGHLYSLLDDAAKSELSANSI